MIVVVGFLLKFKVTRGKFTTASSRRGARAAPPPPPISYFPHTARLFLLTLSVTSISFLLFPYFPVFPTITFFLHPRKHILTHLRISLDIFYLSLSLDTPLAVLKRILTYFRRYFVSRSSRWRFSPLCRHFCQHSLSPHRLTG